jgi:hypothetical protein
MFIHTPFFSCTRTIILFINSLLTRSGSYNAEQLKWSADEIRTSLKTIEWDIQGICSNRNLLIYI